MGTFDGRTFDNELDEDRLRAQLERVKLAMSDGAWRSLGEIAQLTRDPQQSVSARLRDLRKPKFGGWVVDRRRRKGAERRGLHEYRVLVPDSKEGRELMLRAPMSKKEMEAAYRSLKDMVKAVRSAGGREDAAVVRLGQWLKGKIASARPVAG